MSQASVPSDVPPSAPPAARWVDALRPIVIIFVASACLMAIEMVAGRLVSRAVGTSLYTWTAVIGVIFAGMSLGNYIGGTLAARLRPSLIMGELLILAAYLALTVIWMSRSLGSTAYADAGPATTYDFTGEVVVSANAPAALSGQGAPGEVVAYVQGMATRSWPDLATATTELETAPNPPAAWDKWVASVLGLLRPRGPTFEALREQGLPDEALAALLRSVPEPRDGSRTAGGRLDTADIKTLHPPLLGRDETDVRVVRDHLRWALSASPALADHYSDLFDTHLAVITSALSKAEPSDQLLADLAADGVPAELIQRLRDRYAQGHGRYKTLPEGCRANREMLNAEIAAALRLDTTRRETLATKIKETVTAITDTARQPTWFNYPVRLTLAVALAFIAPAIALGLISPVAAQMALMTASTAGGGRSLGNIYAWGAWGSIVGTFLASFVLIRLLHCNGVLALCAVTLALLAVVTCRPRLLYMQFLALLVILVTPVFLQLSEPTAADENPDEVQARLDDDRGSTVTALWRKLPRAIGQATNLRDTDINALSNEGDYQFVKIDDRDYPYDGRPGRLMTLSLDHLIHGYVPLTMPDAGPYDQARALFNPRVLEYDYERVYALATARAVRDQFTFLTDPSDPTKRPVLDERGRARVASAPKLVTLFIGGGAYTFQRYLCENYPGQPHTTAPGETLATLAAKHYRTATAPDTTDMAARLARHNFRALAALPLPAGLVLQLPPKSDNDPAVPTDHATAEGQTLQIIAALHGPTNVLERANWLDLCHLANQATLAAATINAPLPAGLTVNLPTIADVAELDPAVTDINYKRTKLERPDRDPRIKTWNYDARNFIEAAVSAGWSAKYDVIYGDAFNHYSVPYHLTTREFNESLKALLAPGGAYVFNVIDRYKPCRFMSAVVHTLRQTFTHVYVFAESDRRGLTRRETFVVVASDTPQPYHALGGLSDARMDLLRDGRIDEFLGQLATDNLADADTLRQALITNARPAVEVHRELATLAAIDRFGMANPEDITLSKFGRGVASLTLAEIDSEIIETGRPPLVRAALNDTLLARTVNRALGRRVVATFTVTPKAIGDLAPHLPPRVRSALTQMPTAAFSNIDAFEAALRDGLSWSDYRLYKPVIVQYCRDRHVGPPLVLTDDRAPVDDLLSSLFEEE